MDLRPALLLLLCLHASPLLAHEPGDAAIAELSAPRWDVPALHSAGVLVGMRVSVSLLWPAAYDPTRWSQNGANFRRAWTRPPDFRPSLPLLESDGDPWVINTIGHGLFGSAVYSRTRQCGHDPLAALAATAVAATVWEYGLEAFHKQPSAIDLVWTPLAGGLLGEARFRLHRWLLARGSALGAALVDPLGTLERWAGSGC